MKWEMVEVGNLADFINGRAFKPDEWSDEGIKIIRIQNLNDTTKQFNYYSGNDIEEKYNVNNGDLLFSWSGTPGTSFGAFIWNRGKAFLNQHIFNVKYNQSIVDKIYFKYALNVTLHLIIGEAHGGVGLKHITKSKLLNIPIPLPIQKKIAEVLDKADSLRQKRKDAIAKLNELAQSIFLDMFGDPVTNLKWWEVKRLEELATKITDGTHITPAYTLYGIRFISAKNIKNYEISWTDIKYISKLQHNDFYKRCNPEKGDILITKSGSLGMAAIVEVDFLFDLFESLALIKINKRLINGMYLNTLLNFPSTKWQYDKISKGVGVKHLHLVDIRLLKIILPPIKLQQQFAARIEKIQSLKQKHRTSLIKLDNLFNSLMQRAFKGELEFTE